MFFLKEIQRLFQDHTGEQGIILAFILDFYDPKVKLGGLRNGSAAKRTYSSCKGTEFGSQLPCQGAHTTCNSTSRRSDALLWPLWAPTRTWYVCVHTYTYTYAHILNVKLIQFYHIILFFITLYNQMRRENNVFMFSQKERMTHFPGFPMGGTHTTQCLLALCAKTHHILACHNSMRARYGPVKFCLSKRN